MQGRLLGDGNDWIRVGDVIRTGLGRWESVCERERSGSRRRVDLSFGKRRLEAALGHDGSVLAQVVVNAVAGADYGLGSRFPGDANTGSKIMGVGLDQSVRILLAPVRAHPPVR